MNRLALPLRWKLTLLATTVLAGTLLLFGVILLVTLGRVLPDNAAANLQTSARAAINERLNGPGPRGARPPPRTDQPFPVPNDARPIADLARYLTTRDTAARTMAADGATLGDGPALAGITTVLAPALDPATYRAVAGANQERHFRYQTPDGPVLIVLIPLTRETGPANQPVGVLQLSTSLQSIDDLLGRIRFLLGVGTLLAILLTAALMIPLTRGVLRPLRRMATASRAIAAGDLSRRVAVPAGDDELAHLAHDFNEMVRRVEAAFGTQRRFIADASHELRTPLAALSGGVDVLLLGADHDDPAARTRLVRRMEGEIARMGRLVDDLLTLTRFDANPSSTMRRAPVDLSALAAHVADETRLLASDQTVTVTTPVNAAVVVQGDADQLRQVLLNLCANARAHTPEDGTITIGVARSGDSAVVTIADNGTGIAPDDLPHIWDRFYRADTARARQAGQGGLGLGLAIVRAIVEAHGGTAAITSRPGDGTNVTLILPGILPL